MESLTKLFNWWWWGSGVRRSLVTNTGSLALLREVWGDAEHRFATTISHDFWYKWSQSHTLQSAAAGKCGRCGESRRGLTDGESISQSLLPAVAVSVGGRSLMTVAVSVNRNWANRNTKNQLFFQNTGPRRERMRMCTKGCEQQFLPVRKLSNTLQHLLVFMLLWILQTPQGPPASPTHQLALRRGPRLETEDGKDVGVFFPSIPLLQAPRSRERPWGLPRGVLCFLPLASPGLVGLVLRDCAIPCWFP